MTFSPNIFSARLQDSPSETPHGNDEWFPLQYPTLNLPCRPITRDGRRMDSSRRSEVDPHARRHYCPEQGPSTRARASVPFLKAMNLPADSEYYYGMVDAFHQLHCLNTSRKHSCWDSYYAGPYGTWDIAHELHWTHVSHCFEMLLQNLKCNADARIVTGVWMEGQSHPSPDFDIEKKCGDYEGLIDWNERNGIPEDIVERFMGVDTANVEKLYEAPEELYLAKGVEWPEGRQRDHKIAEHKH